jgi:hypothetical protein
MIRNILLVFSMILFVLSQVNGQSIRLGLQPTFGYKGSYNEFGMGGLARFYKHIDLDAGISYGRMNGGGLGTGLNYLIGNRRLQPSIGMSYLKCWGSVIDVSANGQSTQYLVPRCEFVYLRANLNWRLSEGKLLNPNESAQYCLSFTYRITNYSDPTLHYLDGSHNYPFESFLNRRIGEGWGISLSMIWLSDFNRKN